jgi:hypothetical protein
MPTTVNPSMYTSFRSGLSGPIPGDAATGHLQRSVVDWVENLAPQDTPILNKIKKGKALNQAKIEWGSGANLAHTASIEGAIVAADTTINVEAGQGTRFQVNQVIAIYDLDANGQPDFTTKDLAWVTGISTDALTVVRSIGGSTAADHADGSKIEIMGTAVPEGADFTRSGTVFGDFYSNYFQLIQKGHNITEEANVTPNWEFDSTNHIARLMRDAAQRAKLELEKLLVAGGPQEGTNASGAVRPSTMAGFPYYIPSANKHNATGLKISPLDIEDMGAALWESVGDAGAKTLVMSMRTARYFDGMLMGFKQTDMNNKTLSRQFNRFESRVGDYEIVHTRWVPEGVIFGVNWSNMSLHPYQGMDWTEKEHSTDGAYLWRSIYGKFTLVVRSPETMFQIYGFDTDLTNYDRSL